MSRRMIDPVEEGKRGGNITKERHGIKHYSNAAKIGRANVFKNDPEYGTKQAELMRHGRQVKIQTRIAEQLGERFRLASDKSSSSSFISKLIGQG